MALIKVRGSLPIKKVTGSYDPVASLIQLKKLSSLHEGCNLKIKAELNAVRKIFIYTNPLSS